jgi:hypothetical protein
MGLTHVVRLRYPWFSAPPTLDTVERAAVDIGRLTE